MQAQPSPAVWAVVRGVAAVGSGVQYGLQQERVNPERQLPEHEEWLLEPEEQLLEHEEQLLELDEHLLELGEQLFEHEELALAEGIET